MFKRMYIFVFCVSLAFVNIQYLLLYEYDLHVMIITNIKKNYRNIH